MPDQRTHRGRHPEDEQLFAPAALGGLRSAVADLSWLLTREYATPGALKLVGDRYQLNQRQRTAVMRCACSDEAQANRLGRELPTAALAGQRLLIDGYNVLTSVEAAVGGGVILVARDSCYRDMASMHGTYRKVEETAPALAMVGALVEQLGVSWCTWYLDSPVSNSGRLKTIILELAGQRRWSWIVELVPNPDAVLSQSKEIVATADSVILDRCGRWFNLARAVIAGSIQQAWVIDLNMT